MFSLLIISRGDIWRDPSCRHGPDVTPPLLSLLWAYARPTTSPDSRSRKSTPLLDGRNCNVTLQKWEDIRKRKNCNNFCKQPATKYGYILLDIHVIPIGSWNGIILWTSEAQLASIPWSLLRVLLPSYFWCEAGRTMFLIINNLMKGNCFFPIKMVFKEFNRNEMLKCTKI